MWRRSCTIFIHTEEKELLKGAITSLIVVTPLIPYLRISVTIISHAFLNMLINYMKFLVRTCLLQINTSQTPEEPFVFSSPRDYALCHCIVKEHVPYDPHDVQIEGICKVLDN
jgi:hypothetical protein